MKMERSRRGGKGRKGSGKREQKWKDRTEIKINGLKKSWW